MSTTQDPIHVLIREAGGIVHSDGNIFFTNKEQFYAATSAVRLQSPAPQPPGFDAHDMATAAADGFRDGVASVQPPGDAREAFEALQFGREFIRQPDGTYSHPMVENDWREFQAGAAWQAAQASEPSADQGMYSNRCQFCIASVVEPSVVIAKLIELARIVDRAVDDWGESHADGSSVVIFHKDVAEARDAILDFFDELPEHPDPNILESGPLKAARAIATSAAPARAVEPLTEEQISEIWDSVPNSKHLTNARSPWLWDLLFSLAKNVERAHGIGIPATTPTQAAQENKS